MNYLLVMANGLSRSQDQYFYVFAVGIAYVSANLKRAGFRVFTANLDFYDGDTYTNLKNLMLSNHIDVVCTGGLSRDCNKIKEIIDIARTVNPKIITVVGGGLISSDPQPAMRVLEADIGVIGEGEVTMCELAEALDNEISYHEIKGLIFKDNSGEFVITPPRRDVTSIDSLPPPDFDGFDYAKFVENTGLAVVSCSRSCTHSCTFCYRPAGPKYRQRSLENIFLEIDTQISHYNPKSIALTDNLFASSKQRVFEFCKLIKERNIPWGCSLHVSDAADLDMLQQMKESGCSSINYGLESADNSILKSMRKGSTVIQIERALNNTWEANLHLQGNFIFGDIAETNETLKNTIDFFHKHKERFLFPLDPIVAFPGSPIYKYACKNGLITDKEQFLRDNCPVINISKLSESEFIGMLSIITELRLGPRVPLGSFDITDIQKNGECRIEYICRKCGLRKYDKFLFWYSITVICPCCGTVNHIDPFEKALHLEDSFFANLRTNESAILWGAGGIYYKLIQKYASLKDEKYLLVDGNKALQGLTVCDKKIYSPDIINSGVIQTVIITALSRKDEICSSISMNYPSVKKIMIPTFKITETGIVPSLQPI
jgi:anaerobic magnesium-protoporphyrin IX monomethyl ester cyclase